VRRQPSEGVIQEVANPNKETSLLIDLERSIDQSQWLVLSAVCDNNALAHTTPIYIKVDDRPTWCPDRGPAIIAKQMESISKIAREFTPAIDDRSQGVQLRLSRARKYYQQLLDDMAEYSASVGSKE
jgi:hypothetical protein